MSPSRVRLTDLVFAVALAALGCGSSNGGPPDTGAGAGQPVPPTLTCADLCGRIGACAEILCNEDTKSTNYTGLGDLLAQQCQLGCTDATVMSMISSGQWQCFFQSSCRAVFGHDVCQAQGHYNCS